MSAYTDAQDSAYSMLSEYGQTVTLQRPSLDDYDPVTGVSAEADAEAFTSVGLISDLGLKYQENTLVQVGDKVITVAAKDLGTVPDLTDTAIFNDVEYSIYSIEEVKPTDTPIIYKLYVRV